MGNVKFQISVKDKGLSGLFNRITALVGKKMRNNFSDLRPVVEDSIDKTVDMNKQKFIPTAKDSAELGVGGGGRISLITQIAFLALKPSSRSNVTTLSVRKKGIKGSSTIGEITISINPDLFFEQPDSNIAVESEPLSGNIPWMRWLIDGKTIGGFRFKGGSQTSSRTGRGIMIKAGTSGGMWMFNGKGREIFTTLLEESRLEIGRKLKQNRSVNILRKRRG